MDANTIIAIIAAVFGGAGVKVIEKFLNRGQIQDDTALKLRTELRAELTRLREELEDTRGELDVTRDKYYQVVEQFAKVKRDLDEALFQIKKNAERAEEVIKENEDDDDEPV